MDSVCRYEAFSRRAQYNRSMPDSRPWVAMDCSKMVLAIARGELAGVISRKQRPICLKSWVLLVPCCIDRNSLLGHRRKKMHLEKYNNGMVKYSITMSSTDRDARWGTCHAQSPISVSGSENVLLGYFNSFLRLNSCFTWFNGSEKIVSPRVCCRCTPPPAPQIEYGKIYSDECNGTCSRTPSLDHDMFTHSARGSYEREGIWERDTRWAGFLNRWLFSIMFDDLVFVFSPFT